MIVRSIDDPNCIGYVFYGLGKNITERYEPPNFFLEEKGLQKTETESASALAVIAKKGAENVGKVHHMVMVDALDRGKLWERRGTNMPIELVSFESLTRRYPKPFFEVVGVK